MGGLLDIYRKPATRFVAGFFGMPTMNFIEGEIVNGGNQPHFQADHLKVELPADLDADVAGRKVVLGVRAEHVLAGSAKQEASVSAKVSLIEPLGDATLVFF